MVEGMRRRGNPELERWERWLSEENHEGWCSNYHSWIEIGDCVVDFQNRIGISREKSYQDVLLVNRLNDLESKVEYLPIGREFRLFGQTFICIPRNNYGPRLISRLKIRNPKS